MVFSTDAQQNNSLVIVTDLEKKIVDLLGSKGSMTRGDMVEQLQIPRTTLYDHLVKMIDSRKVERIPLYVENQPRGRPQILFKIKN